MLVETLPEISLKKTESQADVLAIILLYKNPDFKAITKPYDLEIYGKKMWKYVEDACKNFVKKTTLITPETDIISLIKPMLNNSKTTLVLFSDTPLISENTLQEILATFESKNLNFMKLSRGYVFKTEYLQTLNKIPKAKTEYFNEEDFVCVFNSKQYEFVSQIIKIRILDKLQQNGVIFTDLNSTFVDSDVVIESGVIIENNNTIKGNSVIKKSVVLKSNNTIINSYINEGCNLTSAFILDSSIYNSDIIKPFAQIIGKR